jgi:hypothetical protein
VIAHAGELTPRQRRSIEGSADDLRRYLDVAAMRRDLPIAIPEDGGLDAQSASKWCADAGMLGLSRRLAG